MTSADVALGLGVAIHESRRSMTDQKTEKLGQARYSQAVNVLATPRPARGVFARLFTRRGDPDPPTLRGQLALIAGQIHYMKLHCANAGLAISPDVAQALAGFETAWIAQQQAERVAPKDAALLEKALAVHKMLSEIVRPATPASVEWTMADRPYAGGPNRIQFLVVLMFCTLVALAAFVSALIKDGRAASDQRAMEALQEIVRPVAEYGFTDVADERDIALSRNEFRLDMELLARAADRLKPAVEPASTEQDEQTEDEGASADIASEQIVPREEISLIALDLARSTREILAELSQATSQPGTSSFSEKIKGTITKQLERIRESGKQLRAVSALRGFEDDPSGSWLDVMLLLAAGGLGTCFYNLYTAHKYIVRRTFEQVYVNRYYIRIVLGLVAGLILGHFGGELIGSASDNANAESLALSRAFLALVGGYSVEAVNLLLFRVANAVASLFEGTAADQAKVSEQLANARAEQRIDKSKAELSQRLRKLQAGLASSPAKGEDADPAERARAKIDKLIDELT